MFLTIITFFIILSILVFVHELGHFLVARWVGVSVEEFGFGLPPRIWGKKIKGTIYSLNWLPIGGFVKLAGEDDEESDKSKIEREKYPTYFWARTKKERAIILLAGVTMNFLLAVGITTYLLTQGVPVPTDRVRIEQVLPNSPATFAGLKAKDFILAIEFRQANGSVEQKNIKAPGDLIDFTKQHLGKPMMLKIERDGKHFNVPVTPRTQYAKNEGPIGIAISNLEIKKYTIWEAPYMAATVNVERAWQMVGSIATPLSKLLTFQNVCGEFAGPIGIARFTGTAVKYGFSAVLEFVSILSLNLAILNILPIPALDGGRLAFVFLEKFIGKRVKPAFERSAHQFGMIVLLILILLVSINDIYCALPGV